MRRTVHAARALIALAALHLLLLLPAQAAPTLKQRLEAASIKPETAAPLAEELRGRLRGNGLPVLDGRTVVFVADGARSKTASIAGDWTQWRPAAMQQLAETGLWWRTEEFPAGTRMEYKIVLDGKMVLDAANPRKVSNGIGGENSEFAFKDYRPETRTSPIDEKLRGRFEKLEVPSSVLGNRREVRVYLPKAYDEKPERRFPTLYLHDGPDYVSRAHAPEIMDHLIAAGKMEPVILVFIPPINRTVEYWHGSEKYVRFTAEELVPAIDRRFRTEALPNFRAVGGASLGGLISLRLAAARPELFGKVLSQSGAFWVDNKALETELKDRAAGQAKLWLDYGLYEEPLSESNRTLVKALSAKGWRLKEVVRPTAHNWTAWRDRLAEGLEWLFPR